MSRELQVLKTSEGPLHFTIAHRPRVTRRMHLEIDDSGALRVVVPGDWPDFYTRRLLRKHLPKVRRFLRQARTSALTPLRYEDGEAHFYRGQKLTLQLLTDRSGPAAGVSSCGALLLRVRNRNPETVQSRLRSWYRREAERLFSDRLKHWQQRAPWTRDQTLVLRLRRMRSTWGTCSQRGVIRLNTHLVKAPPDSLDYVIAHELCHVREMNHGPAFYALQERLYPGWRQEREHLRKFGSRYTQE
jgi:predicted metal-dependent hydrolase